MLERDFVRMLINSMEWAATKYVVSPDVSVKGSANKTQFDKNTATITFSATKVIRTDGVIFRNDSEALAASVKRFEDSTYFNLVAERIPFYYEIETKEKLIKTEDNLKTYTIYNIIRLFY